VEANEVKDSKRQCVRCGTVVRWDHEEVRAHMSSCPLRCSDHAATFISVPSPATVCRREELSSARRKMAQRDWYLRLTVEEADAVREVMLDEGW